jgi:serine/threonine protein phosphatase 1
MTVVMKNYWFIGDIHGELGLLNSLLEAIFEYDPREIIFVGDYIDRGPYSREVLDRIMDLEHSKACIMGNHELMMLSALEDFSYGYNPMELWYHNGAEATLQSFGFSGFFSFQSQIEDRYLSFLRRLRMSHLIETGGGMRFLAIHAGISTAIPLGEQLLLKDYQDLQQYIVDKQLDLGDSFLWTREEFFNAPPDLWGGYMIIHGHTPVSKLRQFVHTHQLPEFHFMDNDLAIRKNVENGAVISVGIDSGSTVSGRLSALGVFLDQDEGKAAHMHSLTVSSGGSILPRDLGPVCPE